MPDQPTPDPAVDPKAAFKAALDRKNASAHGHAEHVDVNKGSGRSSSAQGGKRQFRRKAGG